MVRSARRDEPIRKITFSLPTKSMERIEKIANIIEAVTMSEVIRNALKYYEVAVLAKREGKDVVIKEHDGRESSIFSH